MGDKKMKRLFAVSGLILITMFFVACVNGQTINNRKEEATFVVR